MTNIQFLKIFFSATQDSYSLHIRYCYQLTATTQMIPPSSPQEYLKSDYERAKITVSASVIKMSRKADNMSCSVKTLLTEQAKFTKSYLIRYNERHFMNDVV